MTKTVLDPFGNAILLSNDLQQVIIIQNTSLRIDAAVVIEDPAMMFETTDGSFEKYYLRTLDWDNLVLIKAKKTGEYFIAGHYLLNPPNEYILGLIKKCRQTK